MCQAGAFVSLSTVQRRSQVSWLAIDKATGLLRHVEGAGGGVSVADDKFFGQDSGRALLER